MAIDCREVPAANASDCTNPWGKGCTSKAGFQFTSLWNYTKNIQAACSNDTRLHLAGKPFATADNASLTQEACVNITGSGWTYYPTPDIWNRLTTWKFPLLQLVASFPRPPLSFVVECLVILHLLGDPVDTIRNLLRKISTCQATATYWKTKCGNGLNSPAENDVDHDYTKDRDWKAFAIVADTYGEWAESDSAQAILQQALNDLADNQTARKDFLTTVRLTGDALAADRATKFLPIIVAQSFFIGAVGIAIGRTAAAAETKELMDTVFINVEAHSIAFSALYFWIIPAVFLASIIGASQTEAAVPRILRRFQADLDRLNLPQNVQMPNNCLDDDQRRVFHGGVYSWQPRTKRSSRATLTISNASEYNSKFHNILSYTILLIGALVGLFLSGLVPPDGFNCRHLGELAISATWIVSAYTDSLLIRFYALESQKSSLFWLTFVKDSFSTALTMIGIVVTQIGVFNRCSCYTNWGKTGLALPERPDVTATLLRRLNGVYPGITFAGILIELVVVPLFICIWYGDALRVYVQRDDRQSNAAWFWSAVGRSEAGRERLFDAFSHSPFRRRKPSRSKTMAAEQGLINEMMENQPHAPEASERQNLRNRDETRGPQPSEPTVQLLTNVQPGSSSVDPRQPSRMPTVSEPRRRDTEPRNDAPIDSIPMDNSQAQITLPRKPVPQASPLRSADPSGSG